jgi:hypothetical protein
VPAKAEGGGGFSYGKMFFVLNLKKKYLDVAPSLKNWPKVKQLTTPVC